METSFELQRIRINVTEQYLSMSKQIYCAAEHRYGLLSVLCGAGNLGNILSASGKREIAYVERGISIHMYVILLVYFSIHNVH